MATYRLLENANRRTTQNNNLRILETESVGSHNLLATTFTIPAPTIGIGSLNQKHLLSSLNVVVQSPTLGGALLESSVNTVNLVSSGITAGSPTFSNVSITEIVVTLPPSGGTSWSPSNLVNDISIRLDPLDILGTDGAIATWTNSSGDAHPVNFTGSAQVRRGVQNGLPVVRFGDGGTTGLVGTSGLTAVGQSTIAMVLRRRGEPNGSVQVISANRSAPYCTIYALGGEYNLYDEAGRALGIPIDVDFHIILCTYSPTGNVTFRKNGVLSWSGSGTPAYRGMGYQDIGFNSGTAGASVDIGEYLHVDALDLDETTKLEGYLAHRWGLQASLPDAHPYKSTPPRSGGSVTIERPRPHQSQWL